MNVLDHFRLDGKVSAVTGANRGIGRSLALSLAQAGSNLALLVRDPASCDEVLAELEPTGVRVEVVRIDVTDPTGVDAAAAEVVGRFGAVDVLINNAGTCIHRPALEVTPEEFRQVMDVNVNGVWNCAQSFGRLMVERGSGTMVNIGSISGVIVNCPQWQPAYNAS